MEAPTPLAHALLDELNDFATAAAALQRLFESEGDEELTTLYQIIQWQNASAGDLETAMTSFDCDNPITDNATMLLVMGKPALLFATSIYDEELATMIWRGLLRVHEMHPSFNLLRQVMDNTRDSHGFSSLHYAMEAQMNEFIHAVSSWFASEDLGAFRRAVVSVCTQDVVLPVAAKQLTGKSITSGGCTLLHLAVRKGELDLVKLLMETPIALTAEDVGVDWDGLSLVELATLHRRQDILEYLETRTPPQEINAAELQAKRDEQAVKRYAASMIATEPMTQREVVHSVWSGHECERVLRALDAATAKRGWATQRHTSYPTTDLPCYQVPVLDCWVRRTIESRLFTQVYARYGIPSSKMLTFRELFFVKYEARAGEQAELTLHCDGSVLSFNILLNPHAEFQGGGTYFEEANTTVHIEQGDAVVHSGKLRHAGAAVTDGKRTILVGFLDLVDRVVL